MRYKTSLRKTLAVLVFAPILALAQAMQPKPESLGFSSERLGRLHDAMQRLVDEKSLAGVVTLLMRHGKVADRREALADGFRIYLSSQTDVGTMARLARLMATAVWLSAAPADGCDRAATEIT